MAFTNAFKERVAYLVVNDRPSIRVECPAIIHKSTLFYIPIITDCGQYGIARPESTVTLHPHYIDQHFVDAIHFPCD
jgi:hypothetical protein